MNNNTFNIIDTGGGGGSGIGVGGGDIENDFSDEVVGGMINLSNAYTAEFDYESHQYTLNHGIEATIILSFAYCIVFIIGVLGNIAVFIVVKQTPRMHTLTNQFIANLAIADLLVNVLCLPFTLAANIFPAWTLGTFFCKTVSYLQGVSVSASVNTLMAISLERCWAISCPLSATMSSTQYKLSVFAIWTFALTINLPWLFVFTLEPIGKGSNLEVCIELWPSQRSENIYFILANLVLCYLGPLAVISICYIIIWCKVAHRSVPGEHVRHKNTINTINRSRLKVTKMVFVVIITFALSWLPLYTIFCIVKFSDHVLNNDQVRSFVYLILPIAQWLGASNSCINPIVYAYMNRKFRLSFLSLLKRPCCSDNRFWDDDFNLHQFRSDTYYFRSRGPIVSRVVRGTNTSSKTCETDSTKLSSPTPSRSNNIIVAFSPRCSRIDV